MSFVIYERAANGAITSHTFPTEQAADERRAAEGFVAVEAKKAERELAKMIADADKVNAAWQKKVDAAVDKANKDRQAAADTARKELADLGVSEATIAALLG